MLLNQAQIADSAGKTQVAENFRRAAEMTGVPDDQVIHMYDMLRPNRSTKQQLQELADTLKNQYNAVLCAKLVSDAMAIYEKRGILLK
jgi:propanediol dehydratase small subunit